MQKIEEFGDKPFFIYLAHSLPHIPLFRGPDFKDTSTAGIYGDVIEEIDWSVGQVREALEKNGVAENTLVVFTSDNGPWLSFNTHGGSAGLLREGKGSTWEGWHARTDRYVLAWKVENGNCSRHGRNARFTPNIRQTGRRDTPR